MKKPVRKVTVSSVWGKRKYQQDTFVALQNKRVACKGWLLAVFDGHGGDAVSKIAEANLPNIFRESYLKCKRDAEGALKRSVGELVKLSENYRCGSTVAIVYITDVMDRAYVAILGDSQVVIRDSHGHISVSPEHNVRTNPKELADAEIRGASFDGVYISCESSSLCLQMSRALGDIELNSVLCREPEVYSVSLGPESFVLVGSDGLFDPSHSVTDQAIKHLVRKICEGSSAIDLVDEIKSTARDNVTAILWRAN